MQPELEKPGLKKNQPSVFFIFYLFYWVLLYICPEEIVFRIFQFQE